MPNDYFSVTLAEVLLKAGRKEEAEKVIDDILNYSREYLEYSVNLKPELRFGMDYATGINMQSYLDLYNMAVKLKLDPLLEKIEPEVSSFYNLLYSNH
jgi:flagellar biosynthesis chaperone FliJ